MIDQSSVLAAIETIAENPKVAATVAGTTTAMGVATILDQIQSGAGIISVVIGCLVGVFVIRVHAIKYKLLKRAWDNGESPKDL